MPTVFRIGPYRFYFWSHELNEPAHIHIDRERFSAKFWLDPVRLERSRGFSAKELNQIQGIIENHQEELLESWNEFFGN